jgi:sulfur relay (sulfurtransferase) DsrC/TusE family protein
MYVAEIELDGRIVKVDEEGCLFDVNDRNRNVAAALAEREIITLTDKH